VVGLKLNSGEATAGGAEAKVDAEAKGAGGAEYRLACDTLGGGTEDVKDEGSPEGGAEALEDEPAEVLTPHNVFTLSFKKLVARLEAKPPKPDGEPLALFVMTGAFNPPHKGHLFALEAAAAWCQRVLNLEVAGAVVSLMHDTAVRNKFKRTPAQAIPARHRLRLCQEMVKKWAWVTVDRWEVTRRAALDYLSVLEHVRQVMKMASHPRRTFWLCRRLHANECVTTELTATNVTAAAARHTRTHTPARCCHHRCGPSQRRRPSPTCASFTSATPRT
jgi:glycerol-3-phosphate cytidylyltransferase-like family protein